MDPKFGIDPDLNVHEQVSIARHAVRAQIINPDQLLHHEDVKKNGS